MKKILVKLFLNAEGELSFAKFGAWIFAVCAAIVAAPKANISIDPQIVNIANIIQYFGGALGFTGVRDAFDKLKLKGN